MEAAEPREGDIWGALSSLLDDVQMRRRGRIVLSTTQVLWDQLEDNVSMLQLCAGRLHASHPLRLDEELVLQQCLRRLKMAHDCIDRRWKQPFRFWQLVHEVDALLLLILPEELLKVRALSVRERFERKVKDPIQRKAFEKPLMLDGCVEPLDVERPRTGGSPAQTPPAASERIPDRYILYGAMRLINKQVDEGFWQLATNVAIQSMSAVLLVLLFGVTLWRYEDFFSSADGSSGGNILLFVLLGAGGAVISNMLARESFIISMGPAARYFIYYLFAKPVLGGFSAAFFYLLVQSRWFVEFTGTPFAIAIIAMSAGFFGDRLLGSTMDKVMGNLLKASEKVPIRATGAAAPRASTPA